MGQFSLNKNDWIKYLERRLYPEAERGAGHAAFSRRAKFSPSMELIPLDVTKPFILIWKRTIYNFNLPNSVCALYTKNVWQKMEVAIFCHTFFCASSGARLFVIYGAWSPGAGAA
jgi:hypothetical protein